AYRLSTEHVPEHLLHYLTSYLSNGAGERNLLGANLDTVLRVAALVNSAVAHQSVQAVALENAARGMCVEQPHLRDYGGAHETRSFVKLRAGFHAAGAGDAAGEGIRMFLLRWVDARPRSEVISAVERHPC